MRALIATVCRSANAKFLAVALLVVLVLAATPALAVPCENLANLKLPDTTITSAQVVAAGAFELPSPMSNPAVFKDAPAFCRVTLEVKPAKDSDIKIEAWMPAP